MTGFRERLFDQSVAIIDRHYRGATITAEQGHTLRQAWECAKVGNIFLDAVSQVVGGEDIWTIVHLLHAPGFLSTRERWYAQRLRGKTLLAWRGASPREAADSSGGDLGMSWTTDRRIAEFFARRHPDGDGVVIQARVVDGIWLETKESEVVAFVAWDHEIVPDTGSVLPAWDVIKPIPPDLKSAQRRYQSP